MTTLRDALRASEKVENFGGSFSTFCQEALRGALQAVDHFYGYGLFDRASTPKVELESTEIIRGLNAIAVEVLERERTRSRVLFTRDIGQSLEVIFRHLPNTVSREGWSASLINAVSHACKDLSCHSDEKQDPHRNLLYHSVLGNLVKIDTIPPSIAYPMLNMAIKWGDLQRIAMRTSDDQLSTQYWTSTLEIGRHVIQRVSEVFSELDHHEALYAKADNLSALGTQRARKILAENALAVKLRTP